MKFRSHLIFAVSENTMAGSFSSFNSLSLFFLFSFLSGILRSLKHVFTCFLVWNPWDFIFVVIFCSELFAVLSLTSDCFFFCTLLWSQHTFDPADAEDKILTERNMKISITIFLTSTHPHLCIPTYTQMHFCIEKSEMDINATWKIYDCEDLDCFYILFRLFCLFAVLHFLNL